jgi:hypothetical protein
MKRTPLFHATGAAAYIVLIVFVMDTVTSAGAEETILIPMTILGLFVLSAAVMGYLFAFEPVRLYVENRKDESLAFFGKTVGWFACFVALFVLGLLYSGS